MRPLTGSYCSRPSLRSNRTLSLVLFSEYKAIWSTEILLYTSFVFKHNSVLSTGLQKAWIWPSKGDTWWQSERRIKAASTQTLCWKWAIERCFGNHFTVQCGKCLSLLQIFNIDENFKVELEFGISEVEVQNKLFQITRCISGFQQSSSHINYKHILNLCYFE